jgi:hypothetical protein
MKNHDHYTFYLTNMSIQDESSISVAVVDESQPKNTKALKYWFYGKHKAVY